MDFSDIEVLVGSGTIDSFIGEKIVGRAMAGSQVPFYVCDLDEVCEKHLRWRNLLPRATPFYAVKCNDTPAVLRTLAALGTGFDCASKREMELVLSLGVSPDRIIYAHTTKPASHLRHARASGVDTMTFDCEDELDKIATFHPKAKLMLRISVDDSKSLVRLGAKFGAKPQDVGDLLERARELRLNVVGVSFHVGSCNSHGESYKAAIADARRVFDRASSSGFRMNLLDIGGGFIGREEFQKVCEDINQALGDLFPVDGGVWVIAEPGRYFVTPPSRSRWDELRHIDDVVDRSEPMFQAVVWGPTCAAVDRLQDALLPKLRVGDWLLSDDMGAYTVVMATHFNGFEKAEVYAVLSAQGWEKLKFCESFKDSAHVE
ncbi:ornithine decarboxylase-like [Eucyclogobius newberryi]|uniref:ornithine decarboxylase-like n=1 Tax=Eucyclogobius newberryi TaxID=166745 RepID=UPI003B5AAEB3